MTAKSICFAGNSIGGKVFRDKVNDADMEGNLLHQHETIMDFFTRNLHNVQESTEFNSTPVRVFIFDDRVEIHSPGALPNGLTIEDIKAGGKVIHEWERTSSPLSDTISKELRKRGMKFVGTTIVYSFLQAIGIINSHEEGCWLHKKAFTAEEQMSTNKLSRL